MLILNWIYGLVSAYIGLCTLYLAVLTLAAWFFRKKAVVGAEPLRIAVVIPAHNEELQIEASVRGVFDSAYPAERLTVHVIADNCDDGTAAAARKAGAVVTERTDPDNRGKGQAMDWFFRDQAAALDGHDAIVVVDADTLLHRDFLNHVSQSLSAPGVDVVQGYYGVSNPEDSWRTALSSAALNVFHHLRPAGRNRIGGTAGLKGNGMGFRREIITRYGWPAHSIVEDIEFSMMLLEDGTLVHFNPDAIVYGEMAAGKEQAETQRTRWEGGRFGLFRRFAPSLLKRWLTGGGLSFLDAFMELFTPPLSQLVLGQVVLLAAALLLYPFTAVAWAAGLLAVAIYVVSGLILGRAPFYVWRSLFCAPLFVLWKIPVFVRAALKRGGDTWERTERQAEVEQREAREGQDGSTTG